MKNIAFIFLIFGLLCSCFSTKRTKVVNLEYVGTNCIEKKLSRIYLNDSVFVQYASVIYPSEEKSITIDTFKVVGSTWYIRSRGKYELYFDSQAFERGDTIFLNFDNTTIVFKHIPVKKIIEDNMTLYEFKFEEQHYNYFAPRVLFSPKLGIVKYTPTFECEVQYLNLLGTEFLKRRDLERLYTEISK